MDQTGITMPILRDGRFVFLWDPLKEVKSQFTDWLRLHGKSQVSDSMSKNTDMTTD